MMKKAVLLLITLLVLGNATGRAQEDQAVTPQQSQVQQANAEPRYASTPPKEKKSFGQRIFLGGYFGMQFGSYTVINVSPLVGFRATPDFDIGIGLLYTFYKYDYYGQSRSYNSWGGRLSLNYTIFNFLTLGAEYQYITVETYNVADNTYGSSGVNILFLGGGIRQKIGRNSYMYLLAYYDVLQELYSPYNNVVFRIGVSAGF